MTYLFFDIECCDGKHICSFGYVLADENFNRLEGGDIIINPKKRFQLGAYRKAAEIQLAYPEEYFYAQPTFEHFYPRIRDLLTAENTKILGHSIGSDINYLKIACERYGLPVLELETHDTQSMFCYYKNNYQQSSLAKIIAELELDAEGLTTHNSYDDAVMSMMAAREICRRMSIGIEDLIVATKHGLEQAKPSGVLSNTAFLKKLKRLASRYPDRFSCAGICLSDALDGMDKSARLELIRQIFDNGYNYTSKVSTCAYYVLGEQEGKRDQAYHALVAQNHKVQGVTLTELKELLTARTT